MNKYIRNPLTNPYQSLSLSLPLCICVCVSFAFSAIATIKSIIARGKQRFHPSRVPSEGTALQTNNSESPDYARAHLHFFFADCRAAFSVPSLRKKGFKRARTHAPTSIDVREHAAPHLWLIEAAVPSGDWLLCCEFRRMRTSRGWGTCASYGALRKLTSRLRKR